jgi:hypothetical protein
LKFSIILTILDQSSMSSSILPSTEAAQQSVQETIGNISVDTVLQAAANIPIDPTPISVASSVSDATETNTDTEGAPKLTQVDYLLDLIEGQGTLMSKLEMIFDAVRRIEQSVANSSRQASGMQSALVAEIKKVSQDQVAFRTDVLGALNTLQRTISVEKVSVQGPPAREMSDYLEGPQDSPDPIAGPSTQRDRKESRHHKKVDRLEERKGKGKNITPLSPPAAVATGPTATELSTSEGRRLAMQKALEARRLARNVR